jgi:YEATS family
MSPEQHQALVWIFLGLFLLIGVAALLAITGIIKTEPQFRKWAVGVFAAGVAGVVFLWARSDLPLDFHVILSTPQGVEAQAFELVSGQYDYNSSDSDKTSSASGLVELTVGQELGSWEARFPSSGTNNAVRLTLKDATGKYWRVAPFYPNYNLKTMTPTQAPQKRAEMTAPTPIPGISALAAENEIRVTNYAKVIDTKYGKTFYEWRVFIDEPDDVLNKIARVQYLLHPTFPEPLQVRTNPSDKFALQASGWGQFLIQITITYKDQSTMTTSYQLDFSKAWP